MYTKFMVGEKYTNGEVEAEQVLQLDFSGHIEAAKHYFLWSDQWKSDIRSSKAKIDSSATQSNKLSRQFLIVGRTIEMIVNGVQGMGYDSRIANYLENLGYPDINSISLFNGDGMRIGVDPSKLNEAKIWLGNAYGDLLQGRAVADMSNLSELDRVDSMEEADEIYFAELSHRYGERMHALKAFRSRMLGNLPRVEEGADTWRKQWLKDRVGEPIILYRGQSLPKKDSAAYRHTLTAVGLRKGGLNHDEVELMSEELMKRSDSIDWAALALGHSSRATVRNREMVDPLLSCSESDLIAKKYGEVIRLEVPAEYVVPMAYIAERRVREIELLMRKYTTKPDSEENRRLSAERGKWLQHLSHDKEYLIIGYARPEWVLDADVREIMEGVE